MRISSAIAISAMMFGYTQCTTTVAGSKPAAAPAAKKVSAPGSKLVYGKDDPAILRFVALNLYIGVLGGRHSSSVSALSDSVVAELRQISTSPDFERRLESTVDSIFSSSRYFNEPQIQRDLSHVIPVTTRRGSPQYRAGLDEFVVKMKASLREALSRSSKGLTPETETVFKGPAQAASSTPSSASSVPNSATRGSSGPVSASPAASSTASGKTTASPPATATKSTTVAAPPAAKSSSAVAPSGPPRSSNPSHHALADFLHLYFEPKHHAEYDRNGFVVDIDGNVLPSALPLIKDFGEQHNYYKLKAACKFVIDSIKYGTDLHDERYRQNYRNIISEEAEANGTAAEELADTVIRLLDESLPYYEEMLEGTHRNDFEDGFY